jgi:hypothetical protein
MPSIVYIIRSPLQTLSHALFTEESCTLVLSLEDPDLPGKVVKTSHNTHFRDGEKLSYGQMLEIVLGGGKVITL